MTPSAITGVSPAQRAVDHAVVSLVAEAAECGLCGFAGGLRTPRVLSVHESAHAVAGWLLSWPATLLSICLPADATGVGGFMLSSRTANLERSIAIPARQWLSSDQRAALFAIWFGDLAKGAASPCGLRVQR